MSKKQINVGKLTARITTKSGKSFEKDFIGYFNLGFIRYAAMPLLLKW